MVYIMMSSKHTSLDPPQKPKQLGLSPAHVPLPLSTVVNVTQREQDYAVSSARRTFCAIHRKSL